MLCTAKQLHIVLSGLIVRISSINETCQCLHVNANVLINSYRDGLMQWGVFMGTHVQFRSC